MELRRATQGKRLPPIGGSRESIRHKYYRRGSAGAASRLSNTTEHFAADIWHDLKVCK